MALIRPKNIPTANLSGSISASDISGQLSLANIPAGVSAFKRAYTAKNTSSVPKQTGVVTLVSIPNVVVNPGEDVWIAYHIAMLNTGNSQMHCAIIPHYSGSATGYVGDSQWGIGIYDAQSHQQWNMMTSFVNISQYRTGGGGPFASTGTFTFDLKSKSTNTSGWWGSESGGTQVTYTPIQASVLISDS